MFVSPDHSWWIVFLMWFVILACELMFRVSQSMGIFCIHCWWHVSQAFKNFSSSKCFCKISILASIFLIISGLVDSWTMLQIINLCEVQDNVLNSQGFFVSPEYKQRNTSLCFCLSVDEIFLVYLFSEGNSVFRILDCASL